MKLFTVGPVEMLDEIKKVGGEQVPYFRTQEFSNLMLESDELLRCFMNAGEGAKSIYLTASGTAAMEATIMNCLTKKDNVLIVDGGTFGHRFVEICKMHEIPHEILRLSFGEKLTQEHFVPFSHSKVTAVLINIDETSTGQLYDVNIVKEFCEKENAYLIVDSISSFLCDPYDMKKNGIDVTIISSQKGLCIAPGLSIVVLSKRMVEDRIIKNQVKSIYFDFKTYLKDFERGQTPYTPCVGICLQMYKALKVIESIGLEKYLDDIKCKAEDFRKRIESLSVYIPDYPLTNSVTPVFFDQDIAYEVFLALKNKYAMTVNPTGGVLSKKVIRVAHIGATTIEDNKILVNAIKEIVESYNTMK